MPRFPRTHLIKHLSAFDLSSLTIRECFISQVHKQPCHIVYTDYRPTPLQHYVFPSGGDGLYLVVDEKSKFREDSFQKALNALVPASENDKKRENGKWQKGLLTGKPSEDSDIFKMVKMIIQRQYDPVILFSFSKRECEFLAMQVCSSVNYCDLDNRRFY